MHGTAAPRATATSPPLSPPLAHAQSHRRPGNRSQQPPASSPDPLTASHGHFPPLPLSRHFLASSALPAPFPSFWPLNAAPPGPTPLTGAVFDLVRMQPNAVAGVKQLQHRAAGYGARRQLPSATQPAQEQQREEAAATPHRAATHPAPPPHSGARFRSPSASSANRSPPAPQSTNHRPPSARPPSRTGPRPRELTVRQEELIGPRESGDQSEQAAWHLPGRDARACWDAFTSATGRAGPCAGIGLLWAVRFARLSACLHSSRPLLRPWPGTERYHPLGAPKGTGKSVRFPHEELPLAENWVSEDSLPGSLQQHSHLTRSRDC